MFYSIMKKLHVSAYIGHHQVFLPIKGVYISEWGVIGKKNLMMANVGRNM